MLDLLPAPTELVGYLKMTYNFFSSSNLKLISMHRRTNQKQERLIKINTETHLET